MCTDNLQSTVAKQGQIDNLQQQLLYFTPRLLGIVTVENNCSMLNQFCKNSTPVQCLAISENYLPDKGCELTFKFLPSQDIVPIIELGRTTANMKSRDVANFF